MKRMQLMKELDNLDHFTLLYEQGKKMDEKSAEKMIRNYCAYYPDAGKDIDLSNIPHDQKGIYDTLRKIRSKMFELL